jgi:hypothetical protein
LTPLTTFGLAGCAGFTGGVGSWGTAVSVGTGVTGSAVGVAGSTVAAGGSAVGDACSSVGVAGATVGVAGSWVGETGSGVAVSTTGAEVGVGGASSYDWASGRAATLLSSKLAHTKNASKRFVHGCFSMDWNFLFIFSSRVYVQLDSYSTRFKQEFSPLIG